MAEGLVLIGAGAHARKLALYAQLLGWQLRAFVDDRPGAASPAAGVPCLLPAEVAAWSAGQPFLVAIGNPVARQAQQERYLALGWLAQTLIHPSACIAADVRIGAGSVVCAQAVLESGAVVGVGAIIDIGVLIDHDGFVGDYQHLKPGSVLPSYGRIPP
jgi:acetyltransferase EpsM